MVQRDRWFLLANYLVNPVMRDSETRRVYTSAIGNHVIDSGQQQILGTVDGRALACGTSSKESH